MSTSGPQRPRGSATSFREQFELGRALRDYVARRLVQPIEARIEARVSTGRIARESEVSVQAGLDALGLTVQPKQQELGSRFGEMKEREEKEAHARLVAGVDGCEEGVLANGPLLADRCDDLHRVLEARWAGAAKELEPELDDAPQEDEVPARGVFACGEEQVVVHPEPVSELGLLVSKQREAGQEKRAVEGSDALEGLDRQRGSENERTVGAGLDVSRPLRLLLGGQQNRRRGRALEVEPFTRRDDVRAGERHHEVRRTLAFGQWIAGTETRQYPHSILNGGGAILGGDDFDRPMSVKRLERVRSSHGDKAMKGDGGSFDLPSHTALTGIYRFSNKLQLNPPVDDGPQQSAAPPEVMR